MSSSTLQRPGPPSRPSSRPSLPPGPAPHVDGSGPAAPRPPAPAAGAGLTGRYRYHPATEAWWWSPEMFTMHGLDPDAASPCTQLLLDAQHPGDRGRTRAALAACQDATPFSLEIRVTGPDGRPRVLVLAGEPVHDDAGRVSAVEGVCVDVTDGRRGTDLDRVRDLETEVAQLRTAMASRAAIEQAKGILMLLTGCGDATAFDLLAHISSHTHRKVREVAVAIAESAAGHGRLPADIAAIVRDACPPARTGS